MPDCTIPDRVNILGVGVHALNLPLAVNILDKAVTSDRRKYVCVTNVHAIMEAQNDERFKDILNHSLLTTPDGMPTVWLGRARGYRRMERVYGSELMLRVCRRSAQKDYTHFLYGGEIGVAQTLAEHLTKRVPGLRILGTCTPPFRPLTSDEEADLLGIVEKLKPDFFWVGLGAPKQERFMAKYSGKLDAGVMVGVGAAFDILSGRTKDAPEWMKRSGLEWFHRLCQEPRRLWKRYLICNTKFIYLLLRNRLS